jgi:hypothetical protein
MNDQLTFKRDTVGNSTVMIYLVFIPAAPCEWGGGGDRSNRYTVQYSIQYTVYTV